MRSKSHVTNTHVVSVSFSFFVKRSWIKRFIVRCFSGVCVLQARWRNPSSNHHHRQLHTKITFYQHCRNCSFLCAHQKFLFQNRRHKVRLSTCYSRWLMTTSDGNYRHVFINHIIQFTSNTYQIILIHIFRFIFFSSSFRFYTETIAIHFRKSLVNCFSRGLLLNSYLEKKNNIWMT